MSFDVELEADILAQALRDSGFLAQAIPVVDEHSFSDPARAWLWRVLAETFDKVQELPSPLVLGHRLKTEVGDAERGHTTAVVLALRRRKVSSPRSALEQLRGFVRMDAMRGATDDGFLSLDSGDVDGAERAMEEGIERARRAMLLEKPRDYLAGSDDRLARYQTGDNLVRYATPLPTLNGVTYGGNCEGNVCTAVATTGIGKSTFAVDLGHAALFKPGAHVIHVPTEESQREAEVRYDARFTGVDRGRLAQGGLTPEETAQFQRRFRDLGVRMGDRLTVHALDPGTPVEMLRPLVLAKRRQYPGEPILLVVDSLDHMRSTKKYENFRLETGGVYWYAKAMATDKSLAPLAIWSTTHAPAKFAGKKLTAEAVSESYEKARVSSILLGLMEGTDASWQAKDGTKAMEFILAKNRLGPVNHLTIYAVAYLGICRFEEQAAMSAGVTP